MPGVLRAAMSEGTDMAEARQGYEALAARPYADVLIVGGGINGLATFRDLAMQGVDVALAERSDFVSGASAASSHFQRRPSARSRNGISSAMCRICRQAARSCCSTAPGTTAPASSG